MVGNVVPLSTEKASDCGWVARVLEAALRAQGGGPVCIRLEETEARALVAFIDASGAAQDGKRSGSD